MIHWRIYYDNAAARDYGVSTFSNEDGPWEEAPINGVVAVVVRDPTGTWGRWVYTGFSPYRKHFAERQCPHCQGNLANVNYAGGNNDFYAKYPDSDEPFSTPDLTPFLARSDTDMGMVKFGRMVGAEEWEAIQRKAVGDPDFPIGTPRRRATDAIAQP